MNIAEEVDRIFIDCLFKEDESKENPLIVDGIIHKFGFNPQKIEKHKEEIVEILGEEKFPDEFYEKKGGGWTFLNFCNTKDGTQWGEHTNMEQLVVLGIAINKIAYLMPKEMWGILPGSMPYIVIK